MQNPRCRAVHRYAASASTANPGRRRYRASHARAPPRASVRNAASAPRWRPSSEKSQIVSANCSFVMSGWSRATSWYGRYSTASPVTDAAYACMYRQNAQSPS